MSKDTDGKLTKDEWLNVLVQANIQNSEWVGITFTFSYFSLSFSFSYSLLFIFTWCRPTYKTLKEYASFSHLHSKNFCILTKNWKFSNLLGTLSRFLAIWFLANQILHRRDFQSYYLDNQFIQNDHHVFQSYFHLNWIKSCRDEVEKMFASSSDKVNGQFCKPIHKNFPMCQLFCNCIHLMLPTHIYKRCKCWKILAGQSPVLWRVHGWTNQGRKAFQASFVFFRPVFNGTRSTIPCLCWFLETSISWFQVVTESVIDFYFLRFSVHQVMKVIKVVQIIHVIQMQSWDLSRPSRLAVV